MVSRRHVAKEFKIAERLKFELRARRYNLANRFTGADPDLSVTSATFGKIMAQRAGYSDDRSIQRTIHLVVRGTLLAVLLIPIAAGQYVGSATCGKCHPKHTPSNPNPVMRRSLSRPRTSARFSFPGDAVGEWAFGCGDQAITFVSRAGEDSISSTDSRIISDRVDGVDAGP